MRIRMVTRTITTTTVTVMMVNTKTASIEYNNFDVVGDYTEKEIEKLVRNVVESNDGYKFVAIEETKKSEQIYGMTEEEFVAKAEIITR